MAEPIRNLLVTLCLAGIVAGCGSSGSDDAPPPTGGGVGVERIDAAMRGVMQRFAPPGISVAVAYEDRLVFARAYGSADLEGAEPLTTAHRFRIASVSKPITGIAALRAVEEGLLAVDTPAFDILSAYRPASGGDPRLGLVTVWHLMHHTSGWDLWDYPRDPLFRSLEIARELGVVLPVDSHALTFWIARQPLAADPGAAFAYTNIGFVVLARVIEQSTGFGYEDFVQQFVFAPAGVTSGRLAGITRGERLPGEVEYESFPSDIWTSVFDGTTVVPEPAYGGINLRGFDGSSAWVLSPVDLVRIAAAVNRDPAYPDILGPGSIDTMLQIGTPPGAQPVGVGWFLGTNAAGNVVAWDHAGGMPGTTAYLGRLRNGAIVAALSNTDRHPGFFDALAGDLVEAVESVTEWPQEDLFPTFGP